MKNSRGAMKTLVFLAIAGTISVSTGWCWFEKSAPKDALNVNSVAADPGAYRGAIKVRGIVARTSPARQTFVLIDIREYRGCGQLSCATKFVTVHSQGKGLPELKTDVVVSGEMTPSGPGYLLQAREVEILNR